MPFFDYFRQLGITAIQYVTGSQPQPTPQPSPQRQQVAQQVPPQVQPPQKPAAVPVRAERPSEYLTGGIFTAGAGLADWLQGIVPSESAISTGAKRILPSQLVAPLTQFALFGRGAATSPGEMARFFSGVPLGIEYAVKKPSETAKVLVPALTATAIGTIEFAKAHPAEFVGQIAGQLLISYGIETGVPRLYGGLAPRITEARAIIGSPVEEWGAIRGTTTLFTKLRGIESRLALEPELSKVVSVGEKGPQLTELISEYPHAIYGRTTEIGQMPERLIESRGFTYDIDIFAERGGELAASAKAISPEIKLDIHPFPKGYPIGIAEEEVSAYAKQAHFPYLPKDVSDLILGEKLVQEKLYIQAGRKATSVIGEPSGIISWKYGPETWRLKDVADLMRYGTYLKGELEAEMATGSRLNLPLQIGGRMRTAAIERGLSALGKYWGSEAITGKYLESEIYGPMIRRLGRGESLSPEMSAIMRGAREVPEARFAVPSGYRLPGTEEVPRPYSVIASITSRSVIPSISPMVSTISRIPSAPARAVMPAPSLPPSRPSRSVVPSIPPVVSIISRPPSPPSKPAIPSLPSQYPLYAPKPPYSPKVTPLPSFIISPVTRMPKRLESDIFWRRKTRPISAFRYRVFQRVLDPRKVFKFKLKSSKVRI